MKHNKFLAIGAGFVFATLMAVSNANAGMMGQPDPAPVTNEAPELFKKIGAFAKESIQATGTAVGSGMQTVGKGMQDMAAPKEEAKADAPNFNKVSKPSFLDKQIKKIRDAANAEPQTANNAPTPKGR